MPDPRPKLTSRIQKGGAMLEEMRQLVGLWSDAGIQSNRAEITRLNPLNKATRARTLDVVNRMFVPRFVEGPFQQAWRVLAPLEKAGAPAALLRPLYFWFTALAEPLVYDFCCEYLARLRAQGIQNIDVPDAVHWVGTKGIGWSDVVTLKTTRALLAALRDFGVLEGQAKKRIAPPHLPLRPFAYIAFCVTRILGVPARQLLEHPDWRLFMLRPTDVEHLLLAAHQEGLLEYHAAGSLVSLSFPASTTEEYARVVSGR
jgi:hypothetical protein